MSSKPTSILLNVYVGFTIVLATLFLIGGISYHSFNGVSGLVRQVDQTHRSIEIFQGILSDLQDIENGQLGYLLTGRRDLLNDGVKAKSDIGVKFRAIHGLTDLTPEMENKISTLEGFVQNRLVELDESLKLNKVGKEARALRVVRSGLGAHEKVEMRTLLDGLLRDETVLLDSEQSKLKETYRSFVGVIILRFSVVLILFLGVFFFYKKEVGERKRAEQSFVESEENFSKFVNAVKDYAIYLLDPQGNVMSWNKGAEKIKGYQASEIIGKNFRLFFTSEDIADNKPQRLLGLADQDGRVEDRGWRVRKDGTRLQVDCVLTSLKDDQGKTRGFVKITKDMTAVMNAEQALEQKDITLFSILDNMGEGVHVSDEQGNLVVINKKAEEILGDVRGGTPDQWQKEYGIFEMDGVTPYPKEKMATWRAVHGENTDDMEQIIRNEKNPDGITISVLGRPLRDSKGNLMGGIVVFRDVTQKKKDEEIRIRNKALEASNQEMQDFTFVASHDLQEPLRKVLSFGALLKDGYAEKLGEEGAGYIDRMQNAAHRMQTLITDLLDLTRVTSKARPFVMTDLNQSIREVLSDMETRIQECGATVDLDPLPVLEADPTQMRQLFQNLLGNALKFRRADVNPLIKIKARIMDPSTRDLCRISIEDNGIGFDNQYKDQIFKVFERLHGRDEYQGTGIGLAICRKVVERHGGTITAEGRPGNGCVFSITLPLKQAPRGEKA